MAVAASSVVSFTEFEDVKGLLSSCNSMLARYQECIIELLSFEHDQHAVPNARRLLGLGVHKPLLL